MFYNITNYVLRTMFVIVIQYMYNIYNFYIISKIESQYKNYKYQKIKNYFHYL